jgi:hypothetical protein
MDSRICQTSAASPASREISLLIWPSGFDAKNIEPRISTIPGGHTTAWRKVELQNPSRLCAHRIWVIPTRFFYPRGILTFAVFRPGGNIGIFLQMEAMRNPIMKTFQANPISRE